MRRASALSASGAGLSFARPAIALLAMPLGSPSLAGRSDSTVSTPALVRWAAICAPMTPAPSTAARRTSNLSDMSRNSMEIRGSALESGGGEPDQLARAALAVGLLADAGRPLDEAEIGHRVGQRAGQEIQPPVQLFLAQAGDTARNRLGKLAQHMPVVVGQELAQGVVLLGVSAGDNPHERTAAVAVLRKRQGGLDKSREDRLQLAGMLRDGGFQRVDPLPAHVVHATAEHLVDEVFLAAEVVVDRRDVDIGAAGDLAERGAGKPELGEQFLGGAEDPVLGGEVGGGGHLGVAGSS